MFDGSMRESILSSSKDQGKKNQMILDCFIWDCFLGLFFDVSDCFVYVQFNPLINCSKLN